MPIFFTPTQANELLPTVKRIVSEIIALKKMASNKSASGEATKRLEENVERLEELGCVLKDADIGLVDFPAVRLGKRVYLCWKVGEEEVNHWHGLEEGFVGRKPVKPEEFYEEDKAFQAISQVQ